MMQRLEDQHIYFVNSFIQPVGLECRFQTWHRTLNYVDCS